MSEIIRDNREILKFRGLLSPDELILQAQATARTTALIRLDSLAESRTTTYLPVDATPATTTPFMRLLPSLTTDSIYDFYFPFTPQNIKYSDLSDEIAEIARPSSTPIVVFKSHRLMRVSMDFLVAVPYDGLVTDIESSLSILRTFSTSSNRPVVFFHLDSLLLGGWQYRNGPSNRPPYFNIAELSIDERQRNSSGKITQASVNMTLVENQNPLIVTARISPFTPIPRPPTKKPPQKPPKKVPEKVPEYTEDAPTGRRPNPGVRYTW